MQTNLYRQEDRESMFRRYTAALGAVLLLVAASTIGYRAPVQAADCPNGGTVRFGVEPFEAAGKLQPLYDSIGRLLSAKLGCKVEVYVATNYNAEIEAMRAGKLANGEAIATFAAPDGKKPAVYFASIVTTPGTGITNIKQVAGRSFAFSDPDSTSGHLFPAYALRKNGIDPDTGVKGVYAGSHTASFEAIKNKKVDAGEFNSQVMDSAIASGQYHDGEF